MLKVIYANEPMPESFSKSIFLAGPTPRDALTKSWRPEAIEMLREIGYDGIVFVPETSDGEWKHNYDDQIEWEENGLIRSDVIVFWVPRDLEKMPAFTTNIEWGAWYKSDKCMLGYPVDAPKMRYLKFYADKHGIPVAHDLKSLLQKAVDVIGTGAFRVGGETQVPLTIWGQYSFQRWIDNQKAQGNRLDGATVEWFFKIAKNKKLFFFILHVNVWIEKEQRSKINEVIISRPDVAALVLYKKNTETNDLLDTEIVLVKEFRSPVSNESGFVFELPSGSSFKDPQASMSVVISECEEETGFKISSDRITYHQERQIGATLSTHRAHLFSAEITPEEVAQLKLSEGTIFGVAEDTEQTYVQVITLREILRDTTIEV
jgi:8-oxo-dGTP pyrophosphatase MutT (NUDIX family)